MPYQRSETQRAGVSARMTEYWATHDKTPGHLQALRDGRKSPEYRAARVGNRYVLDAPVKGVCVYCGEPATTEEHVIRRGLPGWDAPGNLVLACAPCNRSKNASTLAEWAERERRAVERGRIAALRLIGIERML